MRGVLAALLLASLAAGGTATLLWLRSGEASAHVLTPSGAALLVGLVALTSGNLLIRWLRWHYLTRRLIRSLPTRASLKLYAGTLPAIATPLYLGELLRTALVARRDPRARSIVTSIWLAERLADAAALSAFVLVAQGRWGLLLLIASLGAALLFAASRLWSDGGGTTLLRPGVAAALLTSSAVAWALPALGLYAAVAQLGEAVSLPRAAEVFSLGTLLGAVSLIPLGSGVAGSSMILALGESGVSSDVAVSATLLLRAGTSWYALLLGGAALLLWHRSIASVGRTQPQAHFDELADSYGEQIPEHVRARLVERKIATLVGWLEGRGLDPGAQGVDVGCGQGWYAVELARRGYALSACDRAPRQVAGARAAAKRQGVEIDAAVAEAHAMPYRDGRFDFAYGINVIHHVTNPALRQATFREIVRVLRPGGIFLLHEINTENPIFDFYMGYVFPLIRDIDDGTEDWIRPSSLPSVAGARWSEEKTYMTFLPDFTPRALIPRLEHLERSLERSRLRSWSAHFVACLIKDDVGARTQPAPLQNGSGGSERRREVR